MEDNPYFGGGGSGGNNGNNFSDYILYSPQQIGDLAVESLIDAVSPGGDLFFPALLAFISSAVILFFRR